MATKYPANQHIVDTILDDLMAMCEAPILLRRTDLDGLRGSLGVLKIAARKYTLKYTTMMATSDVSS